MRHEWIELAEIPAQGREFSFLSEEPWEELFREFGLELSFAGPFEAVLTVLPQAQGVYARGRITGAFTARCDRCLEQARFCMDQSFDFFEAFEDVDPRQEEVALLRRARENWEMDLTAAMWEQFCLALPERVLCFEDCRGLCPWCGQNLNHAQCRCSLDAGDPRLAVFRNLKIGGEHSDTER
jgi:uncharacterized protein